ncbi:MAG: ribonuclease J [Myxococcota bacterium]
MKDPTHKPLTLLPLGGVGRIGMNAMLLGYGDDYVLLDCGVMFPDADQLAVDVVLPSLEVLGRYKGKIHAIVLTHGHEDHIGAVPYVAPLLDVPVYGTRFTLGLIQNRLKEHDLVDSVDLNVISPGRPLEIGPFQFDFLRVTHSIPDCVSLAIRTPVGNLVFTGDFKIEAGLRDGAVFDAEGFQKLGDEGVLLMMSDSTNSEVPGWSGSEAKVAEALADVIAACPGRAIVGLFASNIYRLHSVIDAARAAGRYTVLLGRSFENYTRVANATTNMPISSEDILDVKDMDRYDDDELCIVCTGSQGEARAVLWRAATGTHPNLSIQPTDTIIMSSRVIPGNERRIHQMMNDFARRGAHVVYPRNNRAIHASGHAAADEQAQLLKWVRPKFFMPVHGEYTFLQRHADLAASLGVKQTLIAENGTQVEVTANGLRVLGLVDCTPWYADGQVFGDADTLDLKGRAALAWNGVVALSLNLTRDRGVVTGKATVKPFGLYNAQGQAIEDLESQLNRWLQSLDPHMPASAVEGQAMQLVRRYYKNLTARKPVVLPFVHWDGDEL